MKEALIIIDIQNDYFTGGAMELADAEAAAGRAARLLADFREAGLPVFHIQHESIRPGSTFFLPQSRGQQIHPLVEPAASEAVVKKHYPNAFFQTDLRKRLHEANADHLVICGMMTCMCVDATVRAAHEFGYPITLVQDATAAREMRYGGRLVSAPDIQAGFVAALAMLCDRVVDYDQVRLGGGL